MTEPCEIHRASSDRPFRDSEYAHFVCRTHSRHFTFVTYCSVTRSPRLPATCEGPESREAEYP